MTQVGIANTASLVYNYTNGNLSSITRSDGQNYIFTYDAFGNVLSVSVGSRGFATYTYGSVNGPLTRQTYANGSYVDFTYDTLGRIATATYSDGRVLTYVYSGEGRLHSIQEVKDGSTVIYLYQYDSLGRVVSSAKLVDGTMVLRTGQSYNGNNQLTGQSWQIEESNFSEAYAYNADGTLHTMRTASGDVLTMGYDGLLRLSTVTGGAYTRTYTYRDISSTQTTGQISAVTYDLPADQVYGYTYDEMGNIATYTAPDGEVISYTYDSQGQLLSATGDETYTYTYDSVGNLITANGHSYTYGDANWKDLLTAFDGETITYDASGNPTSYYNGTRWTLTWENGRQLVTATDGTRQISYTYDADCLRTGKTITEAGVVTEYQYFYAGGKLLREEVTTGTTTYTLDFVYDASGRPYAFFYDNVYYYYITNLQGDVLSIVDEDGNVVASYEYDPYGNVIESAGVLAEINLLRYRGYVYDTETDFYYCQSRYYDPAIGRWINADGLVSTGQGIIGNNMFAYCGNNIA